MSRLESPANKLYLGKVTVAVLALVLALALSFPPGKGKAHARAEVVVRLWRKNWHEDLSEHLLLRLGLASWCHRKRKHAGTMFYEMADHLCFEGASPAACRTSRLRSQEILEDKGSWPDAYERTLRLQPLAQPHLDQRHCSPEGSQFASASAWSKP